MMRVNESARLREPRGQVRVGLLLDDLLDFEEAVELPDTRRMTHFAKGFGLDLADALASNTKLLADFLQRSGIAVAKTESQFQHLSFPLGETGKDVSQLVFQQTEAGDFRGTL